MSATSCGPETHATQAEIDRRRGRFVPWILAAFYMTFVSVLIGFTVIAYQHPPNEVTPEAYEKGLAYNKTLIEAQRQDRLGWTSTVEFTDQTLIVRLRTRDGEPLSRARVKAWFIHPSEISLDQTADLVPEGPGQYQAQVRLPKGDNWTVHVTATAGSDEYQKATEIRVP